MEYKLQSVHLPHTWHVWQGLKKLNSSSPFGEAALTQILLPRMQASLNLLFSFISVGRWLARVLGIQRTQNKKLLAQEEILHSPEQPDSTFFLSVEYEITSITGGGQNTDPQSMNYLPWTAHMDFPEMDYTSEV